MEQAPSAEAYHEITRPTHQWEEGLQKAKAVKDATKVSSKDSKKVKADKAAVPIASSEGTHAAKGLKGLAG